MTDTNWFVITGGPSSGKSKTIDKLAFLGYAIVPEAARILIDDEISKGRKTKEIRDDEGLFQEKVLQMKVDVEGRIPTKQTTFFERGIPDSIAYYRLLGKDVSPVIEASMERRYKGVFLLNQLPYEKDYARTEDAETASKLNMLLHDSYSNLGYGVVSVPAMPLSKRVDFILNITGSNEKRIDGLYSS
jgi:predicted ATPase